MATNNSSNQKNQGVSYYNGTGTWSGLDADVATYVLTSNGTGVAPSFQPNIASAANLNYTPIVFADSPYTVLITDQFISCNTSGGAITLNFPNTTGTGRVIIVKDGGGNSLTNNITITTPGGTVLFDTATSVVMSTNYSALQFIFDGTNYQIY